MRCIGFIGEFQSSVYRGGGICETRSRAQRHAIRSFCPCPRNSMPTTSALIPRSGLISTSSSSRHDCGSCGQRCRANSIRDTVPSRESHALNEGHFTFYLHFLFNKLPFMFHKNLCCFLTTSAPNFNTQDLLQSFVARKINIKCSQIYVCLIHHNFCYGPRRQFWVIGCKFHTVYYGSTTTPCTTPCTHYNSQKPKMGKDRGQRHGDLAIARG